MGMRLYVGNLIYAATEKDIRQAFEEFGEVTAVHLVKDRGTGEPRGIAFVEFADRESGEAAVEQMHGAKFGGRALVVSEARPRDTDGGGPRGRAARGGR